MITVIIPCLNEKSNINIIKKNIFFFRHECHLIVDGGSNDASEILYKKNKINFITTFASRGLQQKKGAENTNTEWLFFLHADTELSDENITEINKFIKNRENREKVGYFHFFFREKNIGVKVISKWVNFRTKFFKLPFGDQGLLINRDFYFKLGGHSNLIVMEDLEFILKVPRKDRVLLNTGIKTSFRRYEKNGFILQSFVHIICQIMFLLNCNKKLIIKIYKYYG